MGDEMGSITLLHLGFLTWLRGVVDGSIKGLPERLFI